MADQDDVQGTEQTGTETAGNQTEAEPETQETQELDQSEGEGGGETKVEEKLFSLPDGRKVGADDLYKVYSQDLLPEFTRRSQELAELKKAQSENLARAESETQRSIKENALLKNVAPEVREAIVQIVRPVIEQSVNQLKTESQQKQEDEALEKEFRDLEKEFSGKFDRRGLITAMQTPGNRNFDPRSKFLDLHPELEAEVIDKKIKEALKQQKGGTSTERTGTSEATRTPQKKSPRTWQDASNAFFARLKQSS